MVLKKTNISISFLFLFATIYVFYAVRNMQRVSWAIDDPIVQNQGPFLQLIGMIVLITAYCIVIGLEEFPKSRLTVFFLFWAMVVGNRIFLLDGAEGFNFKQTIEITLQQAILPLFTFIFFFLLLYKYKEKIIYFYWLIIVGWILTLTYFFIIDYSASQSVLGEDIQVATSYHIFYFLPFCLCLNNKFLKWLGCGIIILTQLMSLKRGSVIGCAVGIVVYNMIQSLYITRSEHTLRKIILTIFTLGVVIVAFVVFDNIHNEGLLWERMNDISEDEGSGRSEAMDYMWKKIPEIPIDKLILGYGYLGSVEFSPFELTAHNDFLEVLFDYGLIGLCLYLWFYVLIFKKIKRLIKQKSEFAAPLAAAFAIFCFMSMISHIIIYPHFVTYSILLGTMEGMTYEQELIERV